MKYNQNNFIYNFISRLKNSGVANPEQEFNWLACSALGISSAALMTLNLNSQDYYKINNFISRRESGEPLQYIIGEGTFYGRDFSVGNGVLIPRADTETLIHAALYLFKNKIFKFLDWGTGSGCIAITILLECPNSSAVMLDISPDALKFAKKNIERFNLQNRAELLLNSKPDINNIINNNFDFIISNPPYIPAHAIKNLMREVKDYEPLTALDGGPDGMNYYKLLFKLAPSWLKPNGFLILEIGDNYQAEFLKNYSANFKFIRAFNDNSGFPRCMAWQIL